VTLELEQRMIDLLQRTFDDDPGSSPELKRALEAEIRSRVDRLVAIRHEELAVRLPFQVWPPSSLTSSSLFDHQKRNFEVELQRQLAKSREEINMKIMEMEMAKMIERNHKVTSSEPTSEAMYAQVEHALGVAFLFLFCHYHSTKLLKRTWQISGCLHERGRRCST